MGEETADPRTLPQTEEFPLVNTEDNKFPGEYAVSGWWKWEGNYINDWHLIFRLTINNRKNNEDYKRLGDRTLAAFANIGKFYHFPTYTYESMNGEGNANIV